MEKMWGENYNPTLNQILSPMFSFLILCVNCDSDFEDHFWDI